MVNLDGYLEDNDLEVSQSQEDDLWQDAEVTGNSSNKNNNSDFTPEPQDMSKEPQGHEQNSTNSDTANAPLRAAALPRLCVVQVKVRGQLFKALIDSGSQVNLVSESVLEY